MIKSTVSSFNNVVNAKKSIISSSVRFQRHVGMNNLLCQGQNRGTSVIGKPGLFYFSTNESKGFFGSIRDRFTQTKVQKEEEKIAEQIKKMLSYDEWNFKTFAQDVESNASDWRTKIPGMGYIDQVRKMKDAQIVIRAMKEYVGDDANAQSLGSMRRKDKLKIALKGDVQVEDVNLLIEQFMNMDMLYRILKYRKENGKSIPTDQKGIQMAMKQDGLHVMTKQEKSKMQLEMQKRMQRRR